MKTYRQILGEVFDFENKTIQKQGGIKVEWKSKLKKFGGATVADGSVLREITGKSTFPEKDWDKVLKQVSKLGLDLIRMD